MPANQRFKSATVIEKHAWNDHLFTLKVNSSLQPFVAGQFTSLAADIGGLNIARAYSIASSPEQDEIEFYFNRVTNGPLSNYLAELETGDTIQVAKTAAGYFTLEEIVGGSELWMMATGTGLGPYISILRSPEVWQQFKNIIVVHAVRTQSDLGYQEELRTLAKEQTVFQYVPVVTREKMVTSLSQRFPILINNGTLEAETECQFSADESRIMLCGSMDMIQDTTEAFKQQGLRKHLRSKHGHIITEKYW